MVGQERDVDAALHEVARRLIGRMPGQREYRVQPSTPTQAAAWAATASYMSARIQSASDEMMHVRGFGERAADMSDAAAAAMRAVLAEVGAEELASSYVSYVKKKVFKPSAQSDVVRPTVSVGP